MKGRKPVIVVHGGAGTWNLEHSQPALEGVRKAARIGFNILTKGGSAVDAVVEAVAVLEDEGAFNAGRGSSLNIERHVEMEASVMDGRTLKAGAAGLLRDIKNPVRLARLVMDKTDHVFVVGEGAEKIAKMFNVERMDAPSEFQLKRYEQQKKALLEGKFELPKLANLIRDHPELFNLETVGAVALDKDGNVAAATSTGGFPLKLPGRIGDSPLIGCGTFADNRSGACSATGVGEIAIRLVLAKTVCNYMEHGKSAQEAVEEAIKLVSRRIAETPNHMGLIAVNTRGEIGAAHNTSNLCWAYITPEMYEPAASLVAKIIR
ncbi:MAG: isoaspartyl peptidase/L-asparaginase [Nitrososphaerota archaeon]|nr:isoaspartyl peptidase/L-asparaginase [Candidatus Bathyarchaeota archaeon]MDW8022176.1 isoaspartyl peptidase/L-asparaginase [Nitrososphaerota archaeon]